MPVLTVAPYCLEADLAVGASVLLPTSLDLTANIVSVADDMDALLGFVYKLPLEDLPAYQILLLKSINSKIATGRVLLQLYGEGEGEALHAYGLRLLTEGTDMLMQIANGVVDLDATRTDPSTFDTLRGPNIKNSDEFSGVDAFENIVMRGRPGYWTPGQMTSL